MKKFWDNTTRDASPSGCSETAASFDSMSNGNVRSTQAPRAPVPKTLQIGSVTISPATVLAPMAGVTDTVFRRFIRNLGGCGLIMTEFTSADGVLRAKDKKAKRYLHFYEDEHPISAQLFGSDPKVTADALQRMLNTNAYPQNAVISEDAWRKAVQLRVTAGDIHSVEAARPFLDNSIAEAAQR